MSEIDLGLFSRPRVRHVRQSEIAECGLACLTMVARYHGLNVDLAVMRRRFTPTSRGLSLRSLINIADNVGFLPRAVKVELEDIGHLVTPAILHWDLNHFVVLEKVSGNRALIHDPAASTDWHRLDTVSRHFTGIALELEPAADFEPGQAAPRLRLSDLWSQVRGLKRALAQTIVFSVLIQVFALVTPYYLQLAVDSALPEMNIAFLGVLAIGFLIVALLNGTATFMRSTLLLSVGSSFGFGLSSNVARKLFRLPMDWFAKRHVGDILARFQSILPIRKMLAEDAPVALVDGALGFVTLALMFVYSGGLTFLALAAVATYAGSVLILYQSKKKYQQEMIVAGGREQSLMIETLRGIRPLRLANKEMLRHAVWQTRMVESVNGSIRYLRTVNLQTALQTTIFSIENVLSIWLGISMVIKGGFSTGMVFAFLAYKTQFITSATSLVTKVADFKMLGLHLERLSDIALSASEPALEREEMAPRLLRGDIELRDVFFRYGSEEPFILKGVNLKVNSGEFIAITGPSGAGKSTLIQVLLGLVEPTAGGIYIDDIELRQFGKQNYHSQVAAVLQDDTLFGGTLLENISLFDDDPNPELIYQCAQAAAIDEDIEAMPMRYSTLVGEMGASLSGGQRQRILLARALYRQPRILVMDEATSQLDEAREHKINAAILELGITRIVVAHRRETIERAECVYGFVDGVLRTRGPGAYHANEPPSLSSEP